MPFIWYLGFVSPWWMVLLFAVNVMAHFFIDKAKNDGRTNLMADQLMHYAQIAISLLILWEATKQNA